MMSYDVTYDYAHVTYDDRVPAIAFYVCLEVINITFLSLCTWLMMPFGQEQDYEPYLWLATIRWMWTGCVSNASDIHIDNIHIECDIHTE